MDWLLCPDGDEVEHLAVRSRGDRVDHLFLFGALD